MSERFEDYNAAARYAAEQVVKYGRDHGIRRVKEYGRDGYNVASLPAPSHTFGGELSAERVTLEQARLILAMGAHQ